MTQQHKDDSFYKTQAQSPLSSERQKLARDENAPKELLYFLASDKDPDVRVLIADNISTPRQADQILADDTDERVRATLSRKIARILPDLSRQNNKQLTALTHQILEALINDHALSVRKALAESLKDIDCTPPNLAFQLAKDAQEQVAAPIVRYSKALSDDDLLALIKQYPDTWRIAHLAKRDNLSSAVTNGLTEYADEGPLATLLDNTQIILTDNGLEIITEKSETMTSLQKPLAHRPELPARLALKMANFVEESVLSILIARKDFDRHSLSKISEVAQRRIAFREDYEKNANPVDYAEKLFAAGKINEEMMSDALSFGQVQFCIESIAKLANLNPLLVKKIIDSASARSIVSLAWYANLSMRFALLLQKKAGKIKKSQFINARQGLYYPLSDAEMIWQLEFFGIEAKSSQTSAQ